MPIPSRNEDKDPLEVDIEADDNNLKIELFMRGKKGDESRQWLAIKRFGFVSQREFHKSIIMYYIASIWYMAIGKSLLERAVYVHHAELPEGSKAVFHDTPFPYSGESCCRFQICTPVVVEAHVT